MSVTRLQAATENRGNDTAEIIGAHVIDRNRIPTLLIIDGVDIGRVVTIAGDRQTIGRHESCGIVINDRGLSRFHAELHQCGSTIWRRDLGSRNGLRINGSLVREAILREGDLIQCGHETFRFSLQSIAEKEALRLQYLRATRDPMTGCFNRAYLLDYLHRSFAARTPLPLTALALDIDHFKRVNDVHGHSAGDVVLRSLGRTLCAFSRGEDVPSRIGGDEFILILTNCPANHAMGAARRLHDMVAQQSTRVAGEVVEFSTSIGAASTEEGRFDDPAQFLKCVDERLYKAKTAGRNQVYGAPAVS